MCWKPVPPIRLFLVKCELAGSGLMQANIKKKPKTYLQDCNDLSCSQRWPYVSGRH